MYLLKVLPLLALTISSVWSREDLYSLEVTSITGEKGTLAEYKDKVLLIVNVASECGYTDHNYKELPQLQSDYSSRGFTVLGFPSNDFGQQEPGSDKEILQFTTDNYKVNFPLFSKVKVLGDEASDMYKYLYMETANAPSWNFAKYLIDRSGNVVQFFSQKDTFESVRESVEYLLNKHVEL